MVDARLPRSLALAASVSQPVFLSPASGLVRIEPPNGVSLSPVAAPYARFLPSFDVEIAEVVNKIIDGPPMPATPFQEHD
jgi:tRNA(Ile)-lysidine synthase